MPQLRPFHMAQAKVLVWHLTESEDELQQLCLSSGIEAPTHPQNAKRRMEKMAELLLLAPENLVLEHDSNGKPCLANSHQHISISHSGEFVAIALCTFPIGIDIEKVSPRITRVRSHFLRPEELINIAESNLIANTLAWTAKEALYKAANIHNLTWMQGCLPNSLHSISATATEWRAFITYNEEITQFALHSLKIQDYIITLAQKS